MKNKPALVLGTLLLMPMFGGTPMTHSADAVPIAVSIDDLAWLEGTWSRDTFEARYSSPRGGMILGVSKEFDEQGRAIFFELERFETVEGALTMTPSPKGQQSVPFKLAHYDGAARKAVFQNKAHDWPTDISYQRVADDALTIVVSGPGRSWTLELHKQ